MKKHDHVEFVRRLPKKISNLEQPVYGVIVNLIGKDKAIVKPRYKRFTVIVSLNSLVKVSPDVFKAIKGDEAKVSAKEEPVCEEIAVCQDPAIVSETKELFCEKQKIKTPFPGDAGFVAKAGSDFDIDAPTVPVVESTVKQTEGAKVFTKVTTEKPKTEAEVTAEFFDDAESELTFGNLVMWTVVAIGVIILAGIVGTFFM
jgi:hypothetical protein